MRGSFGGYLWFPLVVAWTAIATLVGVATIRVMRNFPPPTRKLFFVGATLSATGAAGLEIAGAPYWFYDRAASFQADAEEVLEMSGIVAFTFSALQYFRDHYLGLRIQFAS